MFFLIVIVAFAAVLFIGGVVENEEGRKRFESGFIWSLWAVVLLAVFMVVGGAVFLSNASSGNKLIAYNETNRYAYTKAVDEIREGIPDTTVGFFDAANLKQIESFGDAVTDGRDELVWYNKHLQTRRYWEKNPFVGIFIPDLDPDILPINPGR